MEKCSGEGTGSRFAAALSVARFAVAVLAAALALFALGGCAAAQGDDPLAGTGGAGSRSAGIAAVPLEGVDAVEFAEEPDASEEGWAPAVSEEDRVSDAGVPVATAAGDGGGAVPAADALKVRFIDVGQGDCALLTCGGQSLLIDGGPSDASSKLYSILKTLGLSRLDYIVCTHPDEDHCGGISGALNFAECSTFYCSVTQHDTATFQHLLNYLGATPVTVPQLGDQFSLGGATVTFVGPAERTRDTNEGSLVCRVDLGSVSFLFTGDAGEESEWAMVTSGQNLDADVLKVGHHGSAGASSERFLQAVTPDYAVISVGAGNSYGHPTEEALARLEKSDARILRTDELGSILFTTDGTSLSVDAVSGQITD